MAAVISYRGELLQKFNKIPRDLDTDLKDLNEDLADIIIAYPKMKKILGKKQWAIQDFMDAAEILGRMCQLAFWEAEEVFKAYAPEDWEDIHDAYRNEMIDKYFNGIEYTDLNNFEVDFDIYPYQVSKEGIKKEGTEGEGCRTITRTPVILHRIGECVDDESYKYMIMYKTITGQILKKWVDPEILLTSSMKELINSGLQFTDKDISELKFYFKQLLNNANQIPLEYTANKNGWKKENTVLITGSYAHTAAGKKEILALTEEIAGAYEVRGNKKEWIENIKPLLDFDLIRLKCYATVAALIIRFISVRSFIVHNYYESSGLKSVSMQLAASLMGNPLELIKDADSTKVGIEKTLEYNTDTPIYFDETSNNKEFQDVIYMIGNEQGKNRGNKDGGIDKAGKWKTVVQTTGETPLSKGQSTNTGIQMRVIEIFEGIPRLDADYIERVKETLDNNYGLFQDEIIQRIFKDQDKLRLFYKSIHMRFEKARTVFADRTKNYFVALAVAGMELEEVFKENGIPEKDPIEICKAYYQKTVIEDPTIPYYIRALDTVYSWHLRNKKAFEYSKELDPDGKYSIKGAVELKGWITANAIYYDPDQLQDYLTEKGFNFERVIGDWKDKGILEPARSKDPKTGEYRYKSWKATTTINDQRVKAVKIPFDKLRSVLNIRDEDMQDMKNSNEGPDIKEMNVSLIEACDQFLYENPELKNITHTPEEVTGLFIRSKDREELLIYGKKEIIKAFELCKKHK
ncbi:DUF927 domain-containing protein [Methanosarcina sp. KYL-1]|uniref:DUF927 domain-containing protein n=1 Tax=Methanosarcina sp. KYL-1 TaxID=2602068 RepID=UPI0021010350|nr:DUF927 domain-containing protein [Methanosarcina sp. KYL-1]MCQ1535762.1 DUF927 domain-containing protein [Methanosarcina sp. KYL-1]